jgi:hypothetical protein
MHLIKALFIWIFQLTLNVLGVLFGLVIVPLGIVLADDSKKSSTTILSPTDVWWLRTFPKYLRWWDNPVDGTLGDPSFRWASRDIPFGWKNTSFLGQYWWMAIRNPFNYFKRFIISCDVRKNEIVKIGGQDKVRDDLYNTGWQFLRCGRFYAFYYVREWGNSKRAVVIQLGNKFDLEDNTKIYPPEQEYKYMKGFTFEINPFKYIGDN